MALKSQEWDKGSLKDLVYPAINAIKVTYVVPLDHTGICSSILKTCEVPVAILDFLFLCYTFCFQRLETVQHFYCIYSLLH